MKNSDFFQDKGKTRQGLDDKRWFFFSIKMQNIYFLSKINKDFFSRLMQNKDFFQDNRDF